MKRHEAIKHYSEIQTPDTATYPGSDELLCVDSSFSKAFGFDKIGVRHQILKPGRRSSWPHAEKTEEEFVFVIEGTPDVWIDGNLYRLKPGDGVGFPRGTGITHTFINNTEQDVRIFVVGERDRPDGKCYYPLHPKRNQEIGDYLWTDVPKRPLGTHDGMPDLLRERIKKGELKG